MGATCKTGKPRYKANKDRKVTSSHSKPLVSKVRGCPVPDPIICFSGEPVPLGSDGVKMECSNDKCPFENVLLHQECFGALEDHLVKVLSTLGSAKGWTDAQRRANLWDKKGQSLIAKSCRCRCGLGVTRMDEVAAYNRLKQKAHEEEEARFQAALAAGLPAPTLKKKRKTKNDLPKLNFRRMRGPHRDLVRERQSRSLALRNGARLRDFSTSSGSSTPTAFESQRESLTYASGVWNQMLTLPSGTRRESVMSEHVCDYDDTISTSLKNDFNQGSPKVLWSDSGIEQKSVSTSPDCLDPLPYEDIVPLVSEDGVVIPPLIQLPSRNAQQLSYPDPIPFRVIELTENLGNLECGEQRIYVPGWHLFSGSSFMLGETILANSFLPVWSDRNRSEGVEVL